MKRRRNPAASRAERLGLIEIRGVADIGALKTMGAQIPMRMVVQAMQDGARVLGVALRDDAARTWAVLIANPNGSVTIWKSDEDAIAGMWIDIDERAESDRALAAVVDDTHRDIFSRLLRHRPALPISLEDRLSMSEFVARNVDRLDPFELTLDDAYGALGRTRADIYHVEALAGQRL